MEAKEPQTLPSEDGEAPQTVRDVMRERPRTLPATSSMSDLRRFFDNPHMMTALVVDESGTLVGAVERARAIASTLPDGAPIDGLVAGEVDVIDAGAPASDVWKHADLDRTRRLVVVEPDGKTLAGLVCVRPNGGGFCR